MPLEKKWVSQGPADKELIERLAKELNINSFLSSLLGLRGIRSFDEAKSFFRPSLEELHDPFLMDGMEAAAERICSAIENGEKILVYGDYDVDGTTSVALVYSFLSQFTGNIDYYLPNRYTEGYGISYTGIDFAAENGFSLIIALDCGIKSTEHVKYASARQVDFVICDHHLPGPEIPAAVAVLDPKKPDCNYPYKELSGCGIGFKLAQALATKLGASEDRVYDLLDLVAVSIAADIVPITGENRILAYYGLRKINEAPRPGLRAILQSYTQKTKAYTISDMVFGVAPRINAAGRMDDARMAVKVLLAQRMDNAMAESEELNKVNLERRSKDSTITEAALLMLDTDPKFLKRKSTVLFGNDWHKGIIGIVASRVIESHYKPTIILCESNGKATGSARSVEGFDLYAAIESCSDLLEHYGGHKHAAGLTLPLENIEPFSERFESFVQQNITEDMLTPRINYDLEMPLSRLNGKFHKIMSQFAPFGPGNQTPIFVSRNVFADNQVRVVGNNHLQVNVRQEPDGPSFRCVGFGMGDFEPYIRKGLTFDICYHLEENEFNGQVNLQLRLIDLKMHVTKS